MQNDKKSEFKLDNKVDNHLNSSSHKINKSKNKIYKEDMINQYKAFYKDFSYEQTFLLSGGEDELKKYERWLVDGDKKR